MLRGVIVLTLCAGGWVYGQPADSLPAFEVATIKPSPPFGSGPDRLGRSVVPGGATQAASTISSSASRTWSLRLME
jgi:hypothetical protein